MSLHMLWEHNMSEATRVLQVNIFKHNRTEFGKFTKWIETYLHGWTHTNGHMLLFACLPTADGNLL